MTFLIHAVEFIVASVLIVFAWLIYLYFNNLLDKQMHKGVILDFLGTVLSLALIAAWGIIINFFAFSFSSGILLTSIGIGLYFSVKKLLQTRTSEA